MKVVGLEIGPFQARCIVLAADDGRDAAVVDPGFDAELVVDLLRREGLTPTKILLTHAHIDHAYGAAEIKVAFPDARFLMHADDLPLLEGMEMQAGAFGFPPPQPIRPDAYLADGERVELGAESLLVRHAPGHSPGHVVFVDLASAPPLAIVGDVLFAGSVGRTDLWGGSFPTLEHSIRQVLYALPDTTRVIPGHGPETTIGEERRSNPFVR